MSTIAGIVSNLGRKHDHEDTLVLGDALGRRGWTPMLWRRPLVTRPVSRRTQHPSNSQRELSRIQMVGSCAWLTGLHRPREELGSHIVDYDLMG